MDKYYDLNLMGNINSSLHSDGSLGNWNNMPNKVSMINCELDIEVIVKAQISATTLNTQHWLRFLDLDVGARWISVCGGAVRIVLLGDQYHWDLNLHTN